MFDDDDDDVRLPTQAHRLSPGKAAAGRHATSPGRGGQPWIPPSGTGSSPARRPTSAPRSGSASGRRNRAADGNHVFLEYPHLPPTHAANSWMLYGCYEFKMQSTLEMAKAAVSRIVDKLVDRATRLHASAVATQTAEANAAPVSHFAADGSVLSHTVGGAGAGNAGSVSGGTTSTDPASGAGRRKGHLIVDIISTRKHITADYQTGLPYQLGAHIYRHVETNHGGFIITTFVGLSDNTARRVGRDVYNKSEEITKNRLPFTAIDSEHLFIVFPPASPLDSLEGSSNLATSGRKSASSHHASGSLASARVAPPSRGGPALGGPQASAGASRVAQANSISGGVVRPTGSGMTPGAPSATPGSGATPLPKPPASATKTVRIAAPATTK